MTDLRKYPRTRHTPWSRSKTDDDKVYSSMDSFVGKEVVVTEKMDGENTAMYRNYIHARSLDSRHHGSRDWVKQLHGSIGHMIPEGMRICGENMFALHSIAYDDLDSYFLCFNIWEGDECMSWDDTVEWCELLGLLHVPVLFRGIYNETAIRALWDDSRSEVTEGYVIRLAERVSREDFRTSFAKFVRQGHVQEGGEHWMSKTIVPNKIRS